VHGWEALPAEVLKFALSWLTAREAARAGASQVCRRWRGACAGVEYSLCVVTALGGEYNKLVSMRRAPVREQETMSVGWVELQAPDEYDIPKRLAKKLASQDPWPTALCVSGDGLWVAQYKAGGAVRFDIQPPTPSWGEPRPPELGYDRTVASEMTLGPESAIFEPGRKGSQGALLVTSPERCSLLRVSVATGKVLDEVEMPGDEMFPWAAKRTRGGEVLLACHSNEPDDNDDWLTPTHSTDSMTQYQLAEELGCADDDEELDGEDFDEFGTVKVYEAQATGGIFVVPAGKSLEEPEGDIYNLQLNRPGEIALSPDENTLYVTTFVEDPYGDGIYARSTAELAERMGRGVAVYRKDVDESWADFFSDSPQADDFVRPSDSRVVPWGVAATRHGTLVVTTHAHGAGVAEMELSGRVRWFSRLSRKCRGSQPNSVVLL